MKCVHEVDLLNLLNPLRGALRSYWLQYFISFHSSFFSHFICIFSNFPITYVWCALGKYFSNAERKNKKKIGFCLSTKSQTYHFWNQHVPSDAHEQNATKSICIHTHIIWNLNETNSFGERFFFKKYNFIIWTKCMCTERSFSLEKIQC